MVHITALPADSAFIRKQLKAPLGWDNTTEMVAGVIDAINYLARMFYNANAKDADKSDLPRVQRPYEDALPKPEPKTISLFELGTMLKGDHA